MYAVGGCIIIGDFNARFSKLVYEFPVQFDTPQVQVSYLHIPDPIQWLSDNASALFSLCVNVKFVILNNVKIKNKYFLGNLTYRQG